ncbi:MAG: hypothetical protein ACKO9G_25660 [Dolichospermum sp.]
MNHKTLVVRASCPLNMYLITPRSAVYPPVQTLIKIKNLKNDII